MFLGLSSTSDIVAPHAVNTTGGVFAGSARYEPGSFKPLRAQRLCRAWRREPSRITRNLSSFGLAQSAPPFSEGCT